MGIMAVPIVEHKLGDIFWHVFSFYKTNALLWRTLKIILSGHDFIKAFKEHCRIWAHINFLALCALYDVAYHKSITALAAVVEAHAKLFVHTYNGFHFSLSFACFVHYNIFKLRNKKCIPFTYDEI